jgi:serine/threonine-protein kinase
LCAIGDLVADPHESASRRLAICALVMSALLTLHLLIYSVMPLLGGPRLGDLAGPIDLLLLATLALSLGVYFLSRKIRLEPQRILDVGLLYMVVLAFTSGIGLQLHTDRLWLPRDGVSEICILILIFPVIVPNTPLRTFLASLLAASMDPLGALLFGDLRQADVSMFDLVQAYYLTYICAALAVIPSLVLTRLGSEVTRAREFGSYQLERLLGHGGMGEVYEASHRLLARKAAIKLIRPENLGGNGHSETLARRFELEAQATANLHSPHTIQLYDFGTTDDGTFYYVMELLDGFDLETLVKRFGPQCAGRSVAILRQVCDSLMDAHQTNLIHRDIKPANLYVCRYGHRADFVKVLDFGLVKETGKISDEDAPLTQADTITGTPAFMAPEMFLDDRDVDGRTDLYALGCVAYWLLTGELVFERDTPMKLLAAHLQEEPVPPSQRTEVPVPTDLDRIVLSCLGKQPAHRPQSAADLDRLLADCESAGTWSPESAAQWWDTHAPRAEAADLSSTA